MQPYGEWIGRTETVSDFATAAPVRRLAALFDYRDMPWPDGELPPLGHWLFHLPDARQSLIGRDGHPKTGDFLPPLPLQRRMWAGSRIRFHGAPRLEQMLDRRSTIVAIEAKDARSGPLIFVTIRHEILADGEILISEEQDIVYRDDASAPVAIASQVEAEPGTIAPGAAPVRRVVADAPMLFRFSALTFNAHRIHYDRAYASGVEGYPGLVVHGPLLAMLLMDHFLRAHPGAIVTGFEFRARKPLFDGRPFELHREATAKGGRLWTLDGDGAETMTAEISAA